MVPTYQTTIPTYHLPQPPPEFDFNVPTGPNPTVTTSTVRVTTPQSRAPEAYSQASTTPAAPNVPAFQTVGLTRTSVEVSYDIVGYILSNSTNRLNKYTCHIPSCSRATFDRLADLKRHRASRHDDMKKSYWCPVDGCERGHNGTGRPFPRKDKMFQHLSQKHADIVSSGNE